MSWPFELCERFQLYIVLNYCLTTGFIGCLIRFIRAIRRELHLGLDVMWPVALIIDCIKLKASRARHMIGYAIAATYESIAVVRICIISIMFPSARKRATLCCARSNIYVRSNARFSTIGRRGIGTRADPYLGSSPTSYSTGIPRAPGRPTSIYWRTRYVVVTFILCFVKH